MRNKKIAFVAFLLFFLLSAFPVSATHEQGFSCTGAEINFNIAPPTVGSLDAQITFQTRVRLFNDESGKVYHCIPYTGTNGISFVVKVQEEATAALGEPPMDERNGNGANPADPRIDFDTTKTLAQLGFSNLSAGRAIKFYVTVQRVRPVETKQVAESAHTTLTYFPSAGGTVAAPTFTTTPPVGPYSGSVSVTISTQTPGAVIHYTIDGSVPTLSSQTYQAGSVIFLTQTTTIHAMAFLPSGEASPDASVLLTVVPVSGNPGGTVAAPTFSPEPAAAPYTSPVDVTLASATTGATIRYTTDGSSPTGSSTQFSSAIRITATTTIKAKAFTANGQSAEVSKTYTFGAGGSLAANTLPATNFLGSCKKGGTIAACVADIYKLSLGLGAIIALLMIVLSGYRYMTASGNASQVESAKEAFTAAFIGLIIIFVAYILLYLINPDLVKFRSLPDLPYSLPLSSTPTNPGGGGSAAPQITDTGLLPEYNVGDLVTILLSVNPSANYTWSIKDGSPPPGVSFNPSNPPSLIGFIEAGASGRYVFTVVATLNGQPTEHPMLIKVNTPGVP